MIRPLDLQTLYMNLDKVGKEQAQSRDAIHNQQLDQAQKLTKDQEIQQHSVGKAGADARDSGASDSQSAKVKADPRKGGKRPSPGPGKGKNEPEEAEPEADGFTDPKLGRHIDLSG